MTLTDDEAKIAQAHEAGGYAAIANLKPGDLCGKDGELMAVRLPLAIYTNCDGCGLTHIDRGEWKTKLHKTHRCQSCGNEWRPLNLPTVGVANVSNAAKDPDNG